MLAAAFLWKISPFLRRVGVVASDHTSVLPAHGTLPVRPGHRLGILGLLGDLPALRALSLLNTLLAPVFVLLSIRAAVRDAESPPSLRHESVPVPSSLNISTSPLRLEHWNWTLVKFDASRTSSGLRGVMDDGTGRSSLPAAVLLLLPLPENRRADLPEDRPPAGGDRARVAFDLTGVDADIDARLSSNTNPPPLGVRRCAFAGGGPGGGGGGGSPAGDGETAASPPPPLSKLALAPPPSRLFILLILRCRARVVMAVLYSCCFLPEPPFAPPPPGAPTELGFDEATDEASPFAVAKLPFSAVMKLPSPSGSESSVCVREWEKVGTPRSAAILYFVSRRRRRWLLLLYFAATRTSRLRDLSPSKRGLACRRNAPRRPLADDPDFDSPAIDSDGLLTPPSRD